MRWRVLGLVCLGWLMLAGTSAGAGNSTSPVGDRRLAEARRLVEESPKYMHHSKLRRGMKGYGLTVLAGMEIVRFDVEIVSVMTNWDMAGPRQDVILAMLSKQGLEKTGIISGMSGSPVYVRDPADGVEKLIGAVAFGFPLQKEPMTGIQPITQMLVAAGLVESSGGGSAAGSTKAGAGRLPPGFLEAVTNPEKRDFSTLSWPTRPDDPDVENISSPRLRRLIVPLMAAGLSRNSLGEAQRYLAPMGISVVQAGGTAPADTPAGQPQAALAPGSAMAITVVSGDKNLAAVGTVTDVIGDKVLAFGHSFFGEGEAALPMAPAYVHAVISNIRASWKMASALEPTGALKRDEEVAVVGIIGAKAEMIPMTVKVDWKDLGYQQTYHFKLCRHRFLTPLLAGMLVSDSASGWRGAPATHTVKYSVEIDFGELGRYKADNIAAGADVSPVVSDVTRPLMALLNNPFGEAPPVKGIDVAVEIESGQRSAKILDFKVDGRIYRPGETVTGHVAVIPFRHEKVLLPVEFELPGDLDDGSYTLTVCDDNKAMKALMAEHPLRFRTRTVEDLFRVIGQVVEPRADRLYLRLPLGKGGLALGKRELPDLPASKARILGEIRSSDIRPFRSALVRSVGVDYEIRGSAAATFQVQAEPRETLLRKTTKNHESKGTVKR